MDDPADRAAVGRMRRESYVAAEAALGLGPRRSVITYAASDTTGPVTETMQSLDSGPAEGTPARVRTDHAALFNGLRALSRYASAHSAHLGWNSWHHHPRVLMLPTVLFLGFLVMSSTNERVSYPVQGSALNPFVWSLVRIPWYGTCAGPLLPPCGGGVSQWARVGGDHRWCSQPRYPSVARFPRHWGRRGWLRLLCDSHGRPGLACICHGVGSQSHRAIACGGGRWLHDPWGCR